jgi:hypothetical protein
MDSVEAVYRPSGELEMPVNRTVRMGSATQLLSRDGKQEKRTGFKSASLSPTIGGFLFFSPS